MIKQIEWEGLGYDDFRNYLWNKIMQEVGGIRIGQESEAVTYAELLSPENEKALVDVTPNYVQLSWFAVHNIALRLTVFFMELYHSKNYYHKTMMKAQVERFQKSHEEKLLNITEGFRLRQKQLEESLAEEVGRSRSMGDEIRQLQIKLQKKNKRRKK
jgi:hypothetical protein